MPYRILNSSGELDRHQCERTIETKHTIGHDCDACGDPITEDVEHYRIVIDDDKPLYLCAHCAEHMTASDLQDFLGEDIKATDILDKIYDIKPEDNL